MKFKLKPIKNLIILTGGLALISGFLFLSPNNVWAYNDKTTHPDLTREAITFYELSTGKKFSDEQKQWIIQGSIAEDLAPRWLNHFYDPVYERGLTTEIPGVNGYSSKNWAQFSSYQSVNVGNVLNLWTGNGPVISGSEWGDFSYEAAIKNYSKNKEKDAYLDLGHILHLVEDITVPEHTRNDPHPGGSMASFYENWTSQNSSGLTQDLAKKLFNQGKKPAIYGDLASYFSDLASYTNTHFFSPRTIQSELYLKPKIVFEDGVFAYGKDENNQLFDLARIDKFGDKEWINDTQVLQEYWLRLSRQAVINGAGIIGLFLNQAEAARQVELAKQKVDVNSSNKPTSSLISFITNLFTNPDNKSSQPALTINSEAPPVQPKINSVAVQPKTEEKPNPLVSAPAATKNSAVAAVPAPPSTAAESAATSTSVATPTAPQNTAPTYTYNGGGGGGGGGGTSSNSNPSSNSNQPTATTTESSNVQTFQAGDLIINEIMYNPSGADDKHEWVELYNNSGRTITLSGGTNGWRFNDGSNHVLNEPPTNNSQGSLAINAGGYVILADDAATFINNDYLGYNGVVIDTVMSLKNSTSTIKIIAPDGTVIDEVTYSNSWGANGNGKTLERKSASGSSNDPLNWAESSANGGTPGAANNWLLAFDSDTTATSTPETATSTELLIASGTDIAATTTISENITWALSGSPYRLFFDGQRRPTVAAGTVLTIEAGVKIIPQSGGATAMEVQGTLNAIATSGAPIIFTSISDADSDISTVPQKGEWLNIAFAQGSQANLDYVEFRYGGQGITVPLHEMVDIVGATVNINHSKFENSQNVALHLTDSSGVVENSIFSDNNCGISVDSINGVANTTYGGCYGIHTTGQIVSSVNLQIRNNQFVRNQLTGIETRSGTAPTIDSNVFTDNGYPIKIESSYPTITNSQLANSTTSPNILGGIAISGRTHFSQNFTLKKDLPYILETNGPDLSPYIDSSATLIIEPGTIFKTDNTSSILFVYGNLAASTTPDNPIVFTSLKDDSQGGDTNGDGLLSSPQDKDWANIKFFSGSIGSFANTIFNYGGYGYVAPTPVPPILLTDFPAVAPHSATNQFYIPITAGYSGLYLQPDHDGVFDKVIIHNFNWVNPTNHDLSLTLFDKTNSWQQVVSWTLSNQQNISGEFSVSFPSNISFVANHQYTLFIGDQTLGVPNSLTYYTAGTDSNGGAGVFYEAAIQPYSNPALSIDAGAAVVVQ